MQLQVVQVQGARIVTTVLNDGVLSDRKGLNKQGGGLSLGALTDRDRELIGIVARMGIDFIAVSFCRHAEEMMRRVALLGSAAVMLRWCLRSSVLRLS